MTVSGRYTTPTAFRRALTDRLRAAAKAGPWTLQQLQRQVAYDRLLDRLYLVDDGWIVKGATALLARDLGVRASLDVDIYREAVREVSEVELRRGAASDLRDWFRFEVGMGTFIGNSAVRLPVKSIIGSTIWVPFHVDLLGADLRMTGQPDDVPPLARGVIPDVAQRGYRAYPLVDHVADKIAATYERYGAARMPSTRYRDLVDLVAIVRAGSVAAQAQQVALRSEFDRRGLTLPEQFETPDRRLWERGYAVEARRSLLSGEQTLAEAVEVVAPFIDPLLDNSAQGEWNPQAQAWVPGEPTGDIRR